MKKRVIAMVLGCVMIGSIAGCSETDTSRIDGSAQVETVDEADEQQPEEPEPEISLEQILSSAKEFFEAEDFEKAIKGYEEVLSIDDKNLEAYMGLLDVYNLEQDTDKMIEVVKQAENILTDEQITTLNKHYADLMEGYINELAENADYEAAADLYAKAVTEKDPGLMKKTGNEILNRWAEDICDDADYEKLQGILDEQKGLNTGIDYDAVKTVAEETLSRKVSENDLLAKAYEILSSGEYGRIFEIDGSDEANAVVEAMKGDHIIYAPDGARSNYTGTISGLYKSSIGLGYYFFYGGVENGIRRGDGVSCWAIGETTYETFEGKFADDAPNGHGIDTEFYENGDTVILEGTYKDGLQNGEFTWNNYPGYVNSWIAENGNAPMVDLEPYKNGENSWSYTQYMKPYALDYDEIIYTAGLRPINDEMMVVNFLSYNPQKEYLGAVGYRKKQQ